MDRRKARNHWLTIEVHELEEVITDAWRYLAPRRVVKAFDAGGDE